MTLLVVCALLTTALGPLDWTSITTASTHGTSGESNPDSAALPPVGADRDESPPNLDAAASAEPESTAQAILDDDPDQILIGQILDRLAMRHTALPERERLALVHTILREARRHDLDPVLVVAVIEVESAGYHLAVSTVGAMGLMQLLPSTGKELAERMDIEWKGDDTLFDPIINVQLGTAYLSRLAKRYGSVDVALAAYNWGPGRIDRRLRRGANVPSRYVEQVRQAFHRSGMTLVSRS